MAWVVHANNVFALLYRTNVTHLVFIEETRELPCRGGLYERSVREFSWSETWRRVGTSSLFVQKSKLADYSRKHWSGGGI